MLTCASSTRVNNPNKDTPACVDPMKWPHFGVTMSSVRRVSIFLFRLRPNPQAYKLQQHRANPKENGSDQKWGGNRHVLWKRSLGRRITPLHNGYCHTQNDNQREQCDDATGGRRFLAALASRIALSQWETPVSWRPASTTTKREQ